MVEMKEYLQDFLIVVQDLTKDRTRAHEAMTQVARQLLEYRYIFGKFFHYLDQNEPEGKLIRNQFLFVDQYFETAENNLHEMQQNSQLMLT